ncbi:makorin, ring finger protein, 4 isoform X2 [Corythoichthys intestinalis]|uniref:makorin, ring finger protein, 4 isoform X2 n=1 Tax=Corythoichthys intestinalis TaxID=161448 RepID=UPI0025A5A689|nr:makorin, ring finger protein, 4 isoform X2 [Corythoichthys intestinalis]
MDRSYPNGGICRHYLNGSCRYGSRCHYRHELPTTQPPQICRYFQKGACWYGERCRYIHVRQPEGGTNITGRRMPAPAASPSTSSSSSYSATSSSTSTVAEGPADQRGSETFSFLHSNQSPRRQNGASGSSVISSTVTEVRTRNSGKRLQGSASRVSVKSSESVCAGACDKEVSLPGGTEAAGASAAALCTEETEAIFQSRDVICGICMDKVYEKIDRRNRVFGILPNCTHAFCLECIMTWRKTRNLGSDVVKTCPQCRVRSAFYVPSKYWVEGQAKERLIADFKEKFSKRSCSYYAQYKYCPFEADCLYRHVRSARRRSFLCNTDDDEEEDDDDDDDDNDDDDDDDEEEDDDDDEEEDEDYDEYGF